MRAKNKELEAQIKERVAELQKTWCVGDKSIARQIAEELEPQFPDRTSDAVYQTVRYHMKDPRADKRQRYSLLELQTLAISSPQDRLEYAKATGRCLRSIQSALSRYRKSEKEPKTPEQKEVKLKHTEKKVKEQGFVNFGISAELKQIGKKLEDVTTAREALKERFGLSLRIPNILYHSITKRRYYMDEGEQVSLLQDPLKFVRLRSEHIKENWQIKETDPVDDPEIKAAVGTLKRERVARTPKLDKALKTVIEAAQRGGTCVEESPMFGDWCELKKILEEVL